MIQRSNLKGTLQLLGAMVFFSICYFTGRGHVGLSLLDLPGGFPRRSPKENAMQKQLEEISEGLHDMMSRHHLHPTVRHCKMWMLFSLSFEWVFRI